MNMKTLYLIVPLAPLVGAIIAGLFGKWVGRTGAHLATIAGVAISFAASPWTLLDVLARQHLQRHPLQLGHRSRR